MGVTLEAGFQLTPPAYPGGIIWGDVSDPHQRWYEQSATQYYLPGTLLVYGDGRKFRYAKDSGSGTTKGYVQAGASQEAKIIAETQSTSGGSVEIGDQEIIVDITTASSLPDDDLSQGKLTVDTGTAIGDSYKILSNKVTSTDTLMRVLLETPILTAWSTDTVVDMVRNPWYKTLTFPTSSHGNMAAGVAPITVTASYWYWAQTGGLASVIQDAGDTIVVGEPAGKPGTHGTAGGIGLVANDGTDAVWGLTVVAAGAGKYSTIWLTLD